MQLNNLCRHPTAKLLIVDDDMEQIKLLVYFLNKAGYKNVTHTTEPRRVVQLFTSGDYDLLLLDYRMPDMSGVEILQKLAAKGIAYLPVIMLTASSELEIKYQTLSLGAQDFITKPFTDIEILARINTVLEASLLHKRLINENQQLDSQVHSTRTRLFQEIQARTTVESQLQHNLLHDNLTGLPNKVLFKDRLQQGMEFCKRNKGIFSVLLINIDNIKNINNTLGHNYGDEVLRILSQRVLTLTRALDPITHVDNQTEFVARLTGNSFIIALMNLNSHDETMQIYKRIIDEINQPYQLDDINLEPICHTGIVHYPLHGENIDELLQRADIAAYSARINSLPYMVYSPEHDKFTRFNLVLMQDLKAAIETDQLELYLQPKVDMRSHTITGYEALLRWNHPQHGFIPPDQVVKLAEDTGHIHDLTCWVLQTSLKFKKLLKANALPANISINITASDLLNASLIERILDMISVHHADPGSLTLEITEGTMIADPKQAHVIVELLSEVGFQMSIDDFGTGYSSLSYIQKLPVHELKIDKSFVMDLPNNPDNQIIVRSIIDIAHHFNLNVVAEGIEDKPTYDLLITYGCDIAQGYYLSKPLPFAKVQEFITSFTSTQLRA